MRNICLTVLGIGLAGMVNGDDWKMYLRDRAHSSFNKSEVQLDRESIQGVQNAWVFRSDALVAAPTLSGGVLYFGDWTGNFHAVRATDGAELWTQFVGMSAPPAAEDCQPSIGVSSQAVVVGNIGSVASFGAE